MREFTSVIRLVIMTILQATTRAPFSLAVINGEPLPVFLVARKRQHPARRIDMLLSTHNPSSFNGKTSGVFL